MGNRQVAVLDRWLH